MLKVYNILTWCFSRCPPGGAATTQRLHGASDRRRALHDARSRGRVHLVRRERFQVVRRHGQHATRLRVCRSRPVCHEQPPATSTGAGGRHRASSRSPCRGSGSPRIRSGSGVIVGTPISAFKFQHPGLSTLVILLQVTWLYVE